tara:strand:- start:48 stop:503 length:456 start_codon:yes stop_codon:yes gene_type:complete
MDNFDTHKWFKKQYLEEAKINEAMMSKEDAFKALRDVEANMRGKMDDRYIRLMMMALDSLQADEIKAMMSRERSLKENMSPGEAVTELNFLMDELQNLSGEVKQIMRQTFPDEYTRGDAYGAFDFGSSRNQYDITFESILDSLASVGDEME